MIEPAEPPHSHHHATGIPWFDLLVPIAVIVVSIASLLTSLESERSMKALVEQNRRLVSAQSTPLLMFDSSNEAGGKPVISLNLSNEGTGPAQIFWFKAVDSQGVDYTGGALTDRAMQIDPRGEPMSQRIDATLMRSGDERMIFRWSRPVGNAAAIAAWEKLNRARSHLHLSACYCSMFDECWVTEFGMSRPRPVNSCEQDASHGS
jgi:hypothetical protein